MLGVIRHFDSSSLIVPKAFFAKNLSSFDMHFDDTAVSSDEGFPVAQIIVYIGGATTSIDSGLIHEHVCSSSRQAKFKMRNGKWDEWYLENVYDVRAIYTGYQLFQSFSILLLFAV